MCYMPEYGYFVNPDASNIQWMLDHYRDSLFWAGWDVGRESRYNWRRLVGAEVYDLFAEKVAYGASFSFGSLLPQASTSFRWIPQLAISLGLEASRWEGSSIVEERLRSLFWIGLIEDISHSQRANDIYRRIRIDITVALARLVPANRTWKDVCGWDSDRPYTTIKSRIESRRWFEGNLHGHERLVQPEDRYLQSLTNHRDIQVESAPKKIGRRMMEL